MKTTALAAVIVASLIAATSAFGAAIGGFTKDASGTVTAGNTYQTVFATNTLRQGCLIQNPSTATEVLNVRVAGATVYTLPISGSFDCAGHSGIVVLDQIEVTAATTGHAFSAASL